MNNNQHETMAAGTTGQRISTHRQEEIAHVMRDENGDPHPREMEAVAQPDKRNGDDMVPDQLSEIFPRLLQLQQ